MYAEIAAEPSSLNNYLQITFVDAANFERLQSHHFNMAEFVPLIHQQKHKNVLSVMTHAYLIELNHYLSDLLFGFPRGLNQVSLSEREAEYTRYAVSTDMVTPDYLDSCVGETKLFYDTLPIDSHSLIVNVQKGFLNHLADSKDNYREFVLACIRCMDRFNCDKSQLNQLYLQHQLSSAPFELLRCRIQ